MKTQKNMLPEEDESRVGGGGRMMEGDGKMPVKTYACDMPHECV